MCIRDSMETMGSGFPKAMEVAVLISGHQLIAVSQHKGGLRLLTRLEIFDLAAVFGLDGDELNKMLGQHAVSYTHLDVYKRQAMGVIRVMVPVEVPIAVDTKQAATNRTATEAQALSLIHI